MTPAQPTMDIFICHADVDDTFGPTVVGCRDNFDFTLLFEQSILSLAFSVILILLVPYRIARLCREDVKVHGGRIHTLKQV